MTGRARFVQQSLSHSAPHQTEPVPMQAVAATMGTVKRAQLSSPYEGSCPPRNPMECDKASSMSQCTPSTIMGAMHGCVSTPPSAGLSAAPGKFETEYAA